MAKDFRFVFGDEGLKTEGGAGEEGGVVCFFQALKVEGFPPGGGGDVQGEEALPFDYPRRHNPRFV